MLDSSAAAWRRTNETDESGDGRMWQQRRGERRREGQQILWLLNLVIQIANGRQTHRTHTPDGPRAHFTSPPRSNKWLFQSLFNNKKRISQKKIKHFCISCLKYVHLINMNSVRALKWTLNPYSSRFSGASSRGQTGDSCWAPTKWISAVSLDIRPLETSP